MIEHKTTTTNVPYYPFYQTVHFIKVPYFLSKCRISILPKHRIKVNGLRRLLIECLLTECLLTESTHSSIKKHDRKSHALLR